MSKPRNKTAKSTVIRRYAIWLCLASLVVFSTPLLAVDCTPDSITLSSQAEVNSFQTDHGPGCDTIVTALTVMGAGITDLTPLSGLTTGAFASTIRIEGTSLTSLAGLSGLTSLYWIEINNNSALTSIAALSALTTVSGPFFINGNAALTNLDGMDGLTSLTGGALIIENNASLSDLGGVSGLTSIAASLVIDNNDSLSNLDDLAGLTSVASNMSFSDNDALTDMSGLSGLVGFSEAISIRNNSMLASIGNLPNLIDIGGLIINNNDALINLNGLSTLTTIGNSTGLGIINNDELINIDSLAGVEGVNWIVSVENNPKLSQCSILKTLLDQVDDFQPGPGPGAAGIPDVNGDVTISGNLAGCNSIEEITGDDPPPDPTYSVGGSISGLIGSVTLQNNGADDLVTSANGSFMFATALADGSDYAVAVSVQPTGQTCTVTFGSGTIAAADVSDVDVDCIDDAPVTPPSPAIVIPTLSAWGLIVLSMLIGLGVFARRRHLF